MAMRNYHLNPCPRWTEINVSVTDRVQTVTIICTYVCAEWNESSQPNTQFAAAGQGQFYTLHYIYALNPMAYTHITPTVHSIYIYTFSIICRTTRLSSLGVVALVPLIRIEGKWFFIALLIFYPFGFPSDGRHSFHRALSSIFCIMWYFIVDGMCLRMRELECRARIPNLIHMYVQCTYTVDIHPNRMYENFKETFIFFLTFMGRWFFWSGERGST